MTTPQQRSSLTRWAIWVAIGALIAAALVSVVWVLIGSQNGIIARAFLTIVLLAAFAGVSILDAHLAARRPDWFVVVSMAAWVLLLLIGALLVWMPARSSSGGWEGLTRFLSFLSIVLIVQLAVLHVRLYAKAMLRRPTVFTRTVGFITIGLVALLVLLLVLPLALQEWIRFHDIYWRVVVAVAILAAVGTALVPLVNILFAPARPQATPLLPWPTYVDGRTPLPALPDGSPDWQAYYTGHPTYPGYAPQQAAAPISQTAQTAYAAEQAAPAPVTASDPVTSAQPASEQTTSRPPAPPSGYQGYPPPPPLPPR
ncbi:MAG: hypothetical protein QM604_04870 [Microbacterium sp.]